MTGMSGAPADAPGTPFGDAMLAARLCSRDPGGLGGMVLRGDGGGARDQVVAALGYALPGGAAIRRLPGHIDDERLLGGVDLGEALAGGGVHAQRGVLAEADGGLIVAPMAERMAAATAARIARSLDLGEVSTERDGIAARSPARFLLALLDDGATADERPPAALGERLAFHFDLDAAPAPPTAAAADRQAPVGADVAMAALIETAAALGVDSARATAFAWRAARAAAALGGREHLIEEDMLLAARLVLGPRATRLPEPEQAAAPEPPPRDGDDSATEDDTGGALAEVVLAATRASLPADVLAMLASDRTRRGPGAQLRGHGERRRSPPRGRPAGTRAGKPGGGARLSLIDTLRAAAPWQKLRTDEASRRVQIRRDDLRVRRFVARAEQVTIFAVDASGSAALARLAEAKGAVELLLAEAYVLRAQVALIAFRGTSAELLLPPTRSLARARRALADLPGGGGTPLAAGLEAARGVAVAAIARGRTPFIVLLTDGRANIGADGGGGRAAAETDAATAAKVIRGDGLAGVFIDVATRQRPENKALAAKMGFRHLPMPYADATTLSVAVRAARPVMR